MQFKLKGILNKYLYAIPDNGCQNSLKLSTANIFLFLNLLHSRDSEQDSFERNKNKNINAY